MLGPGASSTINSGYGSGVGSINNNPMTGPGANPMTGPGVNPMTGPGVN